MVICDKATGIPSFWCNEGETHKFKGSTQGRQSGRQKHHPLALPVSWYLRQMS
jgi:hypothetical protein